MQLEEKLLN